MSDSIKALKQSAPLSIVEERANKVLDLIRHELPCDMTSCVALLAVVTTILASKDACGLNTVINGYRFTVSEVSEDEEAQSCVG